MGKLVDGVWKDIWYDTTANKGQFKRKDASFRNWVTRDGSAGPSGQAGFKAEKDRYHLYVSLACPWAHRTLIIRRLKGLDAVIPVSIVHHYMMENGWEFRQDDGATGDRLYDLDYLWQLYVKADPTYTGRVTVPVLWDRQNETIVSNESSEIIRMFNSAFDDFASSKQDFYPPRLRDEIDAVNERVYHTINNGVYKCGFATTQEAYEEHFALLFDSLDWLEQRLARHRYLTGDQITEADWRLFTTLIRFDAVYVGHFKCNLKRIADYPHLSGYMRELHQIEGIAETVDMLHIKQHYYRSHTSINPTQVVPVGPALDLDAPHERDRLKAAA